MANEQPPATAKEQFWNAVHAWKDLAERHAAATEAYRMAKARALLNTAMPTEAKRGADADLATAELRTTRDQLSIAMRAAEYEVQFLIAEQAR